jgi:hypothetical protein
MSTKLLLIENDESLNLAHYYTMTSGTKLPWKKNSNKHLGTKVFKSKPDDLGRKTGNQAS